MQRKRDEVSSANEKFCKWSAVANDPVMSGRIKWPVLKRSVRCFEKLTRSYKGQVSRLCDVARISLYFDRIQDVTFALGVIMTDPEVQIMRAKNNLAEGEDSPPQTKPLHPNASYSDVDPPNHRQIFVMTLHPRCMWVSSGACLNFVTFSWEAIGFIWFDWTLAFKFARAPENQTTASRN